MLLDVYAGDRMHQIELTPALLDDGKALFDKMDSDMDAGWKMGPQFVESPNRVQRGQIAAARLLVPVLDKPIQKIFFCIFGMGSYLPAIYSSGQN